jgi:hypothetical protein
MEKPIAGCRRGYFSPTLSQPLEIPAHPAFSRVMDKTLFDPYYHIAVRAGGMGSAGGQSHAGFNEYRSVKIAGAVSQGLTDGSQASNLKKLTTCY